MSQRKTPKKPLARRQRKMRQSVPKHIVEAVARQADPAPARKRGGRAGLVVQKGHPHTKVSGKGIDQQTGKAQPEPTNGKPKGKPVDDAMKSAFEDWKGGTSLGALATRLSVKRSQVRRALTLLAGGKAEFKALRATGAGGSVEPFGGKRASGGKRAEVVAADDKKVPIVESMKASEGWRTRRLWAPRNVTIKDVGTVSAREQVGIVHIAPDGTEYVECRTASEKADLRRPSGVNHGTFLRFRLFESSPVAKKVAHHEKLVARGEKALERTRTRKRAAKQARTTRRK
jgi:hypothetical protein